MLLDEPTNHLDIVSIAWLENFLSWEFSGLLMFVSHDRDFLNNLATHILDIDYQTITDYTGHYDKFVQEKENVLALKGHDLKHKQQKIAEMQRFVDRFRASPSKARQAQARIKMIDRIELPDIPDSSRRAPHFNFTQESQSGKDVLKVKNLCKSFGEHAVLRNASFTLQRGQRCAIIGPNGVGKSTLLKLALNKISPDSGQCEWGHAINTDYFAQDYQHDLPADTSIWEWLSHAIKIHKNETSLRQALGQMLFLRDDIKKEFAQLSGGEAARVVFARMMLDQANVLLLDEPTNHLDLEAVDALGEALCEYPGTVLFVSHNRRFVANVATRIIALTERGLQDFDGTYEEYHARYGNDYLERLR